MLSPILANVYLHELDCYVERLITDFEKGKVRAENPEYKKVRNAANWLSKRIEQTPASDERADMLKMKKALHRQQLTIPSQNQYDPNFRRLRYCRYADDFVLSAICPKEEAEGNYRKIGTFHERAKVVDSLPGYTLGIAGCRHNLTPRAQRSMTPRCQPRWND